MGNSSSLISLDNDKKFIWNPNQEMQNFSFNKINNPLLYYEKNISFFIETSTESDFFPFSKKKNHKSRDLAKLLLGFYEELDNIPSILETLIENDVEPENNVIKYFFNCFYCYTQNTNNRIILHKYISEFSTKFLSSFDIESIDSEQPTFSTLLSALSTSFSILDNLNMSYQAFIPFLDFMINSSTTSSITPPSPEFLPEDKNFNIMKDQIIRAEYINPHGICSNGNFLFILCSNNTIQIFPLVNGGSFSSLKVIKLNNIGFIIPQDASINAFADSVQIIYNENDEYKCLNFDIESLILDKIPVKIKPTPYEFNCKCSCSDGITQIMIEPDYSIRVFDLSQKKQLSIAKFDHSLSALPEDLSSTIVETNGYFISFITQNINSSVNISNNNQQTNENNNSNNNDNNENNNNNNDNDNNNNNNNDNNNNDINGNYVIYKTYSINGKFLREEKYQMNEPMIASCMDSINKCHWSVISGGNSNFLIRRYNSIGGENPEIFNINRYEYPTDQKTTPLSFVCKFISSLHRHLRGMMNSQVSPNLFLLSKISDFNKLFKFLDKMINLPDEKYELLKDFKQATIECLVILISLNLKKISCTTSKPDESITTKIIEIVQKLPINLACLLFFSNFDYLMFDQKDETILLLIKLLKSMTSDLLIMFSFRMMEQSKSLPMISFKKTNYLFDLLPQDCKKTSSIETTILIFLLLHQRVLIRNALLFLKDNHLEVINFLPNNKEKTILDLLGDYMQNIISIFENVFSSFEPNEIDNLAIFDLFSNFINLLSSLSEFHSVSQITTAFISVIVNSLTKIFNSYPKQVLMIVFILGKLASTLLKGDEMTSLETKFSWLILSNMDLIDHPDLINNLDNENIEHFEDERINIFLKSDNDSINSIYKKIKPLINKNLNDQVKQIDRLAIMAFSKHLNCIDELLSFNKDNKPTDQLRWAFDQMVVVRNEFRRCIQNKKDPTIYKIKCLMLLRMKNVKNLDKTIKLSDFVIMKFEPSYFKKIIIGQRKRIQTTLVGFSLLDQTYTLNTDPLIHKIINYNLTLIKSFENMESIIKMIKLNKNQEIQIFQFFERMIKCSVKENSMLLIIVCYRFFRDVECLKDIKKLILNTTLDVYKLSPNNISIFALALSLIKGTTEIPQQLLRIESNNDLYYWILLFEATKNNAPSSDFASSVIQYFSNSEISNEEIRPILRVIYNIQQLIIEYEIFFSNCFLYIGNEIKKFHNYSKSSEIINFLRQILINDDAPLRKNLIDYILCFNDQANEDLLLGIMAVLGLNIEEIHQFSIINYHPNRTEMYKYYVIELEKDNILCYPKPFRLLSSNKISIPFDSCIYSVPMTDMLPEKIQYYEFIIEFFLPFHQFLNSKSLLYSIYMQVFASYCRIPDFVSIISDEILSKIYEESIPFHDILKTIEYIKKLNNTKIEQQMCGFNVLSLTGFKYTTFLSPVIDENAEKFELNVRFPKIPWNGLYIGIVSDNLESYYTRYKLVSFPDGNVFPRDFDSSPDHFTNLDQNIKIVVKYKSKKFKVNDKSFQFPIGCQFRVIFATKMKNHHLITIKIDSKSAVFNQEAIVPIQTFNISKTSVLYSSCRMPNALPYDYKKLPDFPQIVSNYSGIEKYIFIDPHSNIIIHGINSTSMSEPLYNSLLSGAFRKISFQYSTISLMRIVNRDIKYAKPIVFKLFKYFIYLIESFSVPLMEQNNFPFDITMPIWTKDVDPTYFSLENEAKKALQKIVSDQENVEIIARKISKLFNSKKIHSSMFPQESLKLLMNKQIDINLNRGKSYLLFNNDFEVSDKKTIKIFYDNLELPIIYTTKSKAVNVKIVDENSFIGYLCINPLNNDWLVNTPIELLLFLKNFVYIATKEEHQTMIKSIILNCFIINSPVISLYLNQFADFVLSQIPPSLADQGNMYKTVLTLTGSRLKDLPNQTFINFYQREQQLLFNKKAAELSCHFPEFLASPFPKPKNKICKIPFVTIDPGDLNDNFSDHISSFRTFLKSYNSLVGFPFWEILPYWIKLTDLELTINDSNNSNSFMKPKAIRINNEIIKVSNPTNSTIKVYLKKRTENEERTPIDSLLMYSNSKDFNNAEYINSFHFKNPISIKKGDTFFALCLLDQSNSWDLFYLDLEYNDQRQRETRRNVSKTDLFVNDDEIRESFINDMKLFAVEWRESDTYELLTQIPHQKFSTQKFEEIERIARLSSLSTIYNSTVVALRAMILHHYNYIYTFHHDKVSEEIWSKTNSLLSIDIQSQIALSRIINEDSMPHILIDRVESQLLVNEKKGNHHNSIISQLSTQINRIGASKFRNKDRPWEVKYKNENGLDAGGLCRDLIVEASASIFQPTSKLMVQVDGSTRDETLYYFVPNENALDDLDVFYSIGVLIGIIIRTGLIQDVPLAPFIWKWIAGEVITDEDIFECDRNFRQIFDNHDSSSLKWNAICWDGSISKFKNKDPNLLVKEEQFLQYRHECAVFRKQSIKLMVEKIRKGFFDNTGINRSIKLKGLLLSRLAQGSGIITVDQLMKITDISTDFRDGMNNEYIKRFWRVVAKFNQNELKLLFKFITSLTRIPSDSRLNSNFRIKIDKLIRRNPNSFLPNSSTCFNALHLPCYSNDDVAYNKILYAIKFCSSIQNF